ncbi:T6SS phospholipase effector Tle1-like catalytic domain-containing protein [Vibrio profundum]|uniref:T6SS phospholipase effector Tle1-like catalytic domain-containing protein n=1 Tax=Vibrio profundum TaxID=2910247 RepID=UPI003D12222C
MSPEEIHARIDAGTDEVGTGEAFAIAPEDLVTEHIVPNKYLDEKTGGFYKWQSLLDHLHSLLTDPKTQYNQVTRVEFDIFGFSRGAALARHFVNAALAGLPDYTRSRTGSDGLSISPSLLSGFEDHRVNIDTGYEIDSTREVSIRFVGLFDTVGSFYWPGNEDNGNFQLGLKPECAKTVVQLCAYHEYRKNFPLTSLKTNGQLPDNFHQEVFPGAHSDVGGGYVHLRQYYNLNLPQRYQHPVLDTYNHDLIKTETLQDEYNAERRTAPNPSMGKDRANRMMEHVRQEKELELNNNLQQNDISGRVKCVNWNLYSYRLQPISNALAGLSQERMKQLAELTGVQWNTSQYELPADYDDSLVKSLWQQLNSKPIGTIQYTDWCNTISPNEHQYVHRPHDYLINPGWSNAKEYLVNRPTYNSQGELHRQVFDNVY